MNRICVIIPMYGQAEYTKTCVDLTIQNAGVPCDILVVDDGSPEPYVDSRVTVLRLDDNRGFTGAINAGILWAQERNYDYVHLLNNDTEPRAGFIAYLLEEMAEDVAVASSVRLHPNPVMLYSTPIPAQGITCEYEVELYGIDLIRGYQAVIRLAQLKNEVIECNWVPTCSSLIPMRVIRELGLFDKHMRTHSSDLDYCLRAKIAGYRILIVTDSRVVHFHEVTTKANGISPENDQRYLLEKLSGLHYAQFMAKIPLDAEQKTYGRIQFEVYK